MMVDVREESSAILARYAKIPISFLVERILVPRADRAGGFLLEEQAVASFWVKDYDASDGEHPLRWAEHFDISNWGILVARRDGTIVGGATIAFDTPSLRMLEGRKDLAVLWDIRVAPPARGGGVGGALFAAAEDWAAARGCEWLKVETQNVNVAACRFYERMGCTLRSIDASAYPELPEEVQMIWVKRVA